MTSHEGVSRTCLVKELLQLIWPGTPERPRVGYTYYDNPILEDQIVTRDNVITGLQAGSNQTNADADLPPPKLLRHDSRLSGPAAPSPW